MPDLVFLTGATGFIGSAIATEVLRSGYHLRVSLRKPSQRLRNLLSNFEDRIEYVSVPDLTDEVVLQKQLEGVKYIFHVASPLPQKLHGSEYFVPVVRGTMAMLHSAAKTSSVEKVVLTSSIAALMPMSGIPPEGIVKEENNWNFRVVLPEDLLQRGDDDSTQLLMYHASKLQADQAAWAFWTDNSPHYSLVSLHPSLVYGKNLMQGDASGLEGTSNEVLWKFITEGNHHRDGVPGVHIEDVVEAHMKSLEQKICGGSRYFLAVSATNAEVEDVARKWSLCTGLEVPNHHKFQGIKVDASKASKELGIVFKSFHKMAADMMEQQLQLRV